MIDIHCHILPNFDDGASSLEESLQMVRMAHATGVSVIVSTPHLPGRPDFLNRLPVVMELYRMLRDAMEQADQHTREELELTAKLSRQILQGREVELP